MPTLLLHILSYYTCTFSAISNVALIAGTVETPLGVNALCILMTVVQVITLTFINVCMTKKWSMSP